MTPEQAEQIKQLQAHGRGKLRATPTNASTDWWFFYITRIFVDTLDGAVRYQCWRERKGQGGFIHTNQGVYFDQFTLERVDS